MAIKLNYNSVEDIPEGYSDLYTEQDDGTVQLTGVDGMKTPSDYEKLRTALKKERKLREEAEKKVESFDVSAEDYEAMQEELETLRINASGGSDDEKVQELVEKKVELVRNRYEKEKAKLTAKLDETQGLYRTLEGKVTESALSDQVRAAATKLNVIPAAHEDVLLAAKLHLKKQDDGSFMTDDLSNVEEWLSGTLENKAHWLPPSKGGGAGGSGGNVGIPTGKDNPWSKEGWNYTKQARLFQELGKEKAQKYAAAANSNFNF